MGIFATSAVFAVLLLSYQGTAAAPGCVFTVVDKTMNLEGDCSTEKTIFVPDGFTLDGAGFTITAIDPKNGHFTGAVIQNSGSTAHVTNVNIATSSLDNVCDSQDDRLRGIFFKGASGTITNNEITNINQRTGSCQEGDAIVVENAPFDGTHPNTKTVKISQNHIANYQQTGIAISGDIDVSIQNNIVGASALQSNLIANSIQVGFGATGIISENSVSGNIWNGLDGTSSAILIYYADNVRIFENTIYGDVGVGIQLLGNHAVVEKNNIHDYQNNADSTVGKATYHIGIANLGEFNSFDSNLIKGFETPYLGV